MLAVGSTGTLRKCKHKWNNGVRVTVESPVKDEYGCFLVADSEGNRYRVGDENFLPDNKEQ